MPRIRIACCQINTVVGDLDGNANRIIAALQQAEDAKCDIAVFPELSITGYPPEDLLLKSGFVASNQETLNKVAARVGECVAVLGFVDSDRDLFNAAAVCANGEVVGTYRKRLLPNYAVFDEKRYFAPGTTPHQLFEVAGVQIGIVICEDAWSPSGPIAELAAGGAELIVNLNASPYYAGRVHERERMLATRASDSSCAIAYVNQVGGQDDLVFDGASLIIDADGTLLSTAQQFKEQVMVTDVNVQPVFHKRLVDPRDRNLAPALPSISISKMSRSDDKVPPTFVAPLDEVAEIYEALVLGTRDYVNKNGFADVAVGMSGGIDSALVAAIAVDAVGSEHVHAVAMPSRYSSSASLDDAQLACDRMGIELRQIPIEPAHESFTAMLADSFLNRDADLTEENLQSRIRGVLLMALSNKFGWLVLTTGNKSEMAVGYSTLYGDTAGGFAVIKDVYKTMVYRLCRYRNALAGLDIIPDEILNKAPSAELRPDQRDDQSLPPYEILDPILKAYIERDVTLNELLSIDLAEEHVVRRVVNLVDKAEYKRRQMPPGVRVTPKAFGKDRRMPITNGFSG